MQLMSSFKCIHAINELIYRHSPTLILNAMIYDLSEIYLKLSIFYNKINKAGSAIRWNRRHHCLCHPLEPPSLLPVPSIGTAVITACAIRWNRRHHCLCHPLEPPSSLPVPSVGTVVITSQCPLLESRHY